MSLVALNFNGGTGGGSDLERDQTVTPEQEGHVATFDCLVLSMPTFYS
jgi:hypothetical protein